MDGENKPATPANSIILAIPNTQSEETVLGTLAKVEIVILADDVSGC